MIPSENKVKKICLVLKVVIGLTIASHSSLIYAEKVNAWLRLNGGYQDVEYKNIPVDGRGAATQGIGWLPLRENEKGLLFAQGQLSFVEEGVKQGSLMLGHRHYFSGGRVGGYWLGYDFIDLGIPENLNQFSFGMEMLAQDWDLRATFRLPDDYLGSRVAGSSTSTNTINTTTTEDSSNSYLDYIDDYSGLAGFEGFPDDNVWYRTDTTTTLTTSSEVITTNQLLRQRFYAFDSANVEVGYRIPLEKHFVSQRDARMRS